MISKPLARKENIVLQELDDEVLVYDLNINKAFSLNNTSALIWKLCDGKSTVSEIAEKISRQLDCHVDEDLVWIALDQFSKDGLLKNGEDLGDHFAGLSRREAIRKVGIASMVALPVISSIVAPPASSAQSAAPACTSVCFPPGPDACAGCSSPANFVRYFSTTGVCVGVDTDFGSINCSGTTITSGFDLMRN